ncbi:glycoside hydrolase family 13 protein [Alicyclobacillus acidiphilus]|uniref:glycoside hydrolase family 13 protein n=1 Tax=Alicyclobacillus acidiphilus TaxID=182455 RepID=UPI00082ADA58|nr:alpha-glucosidase [Alicyclobacillus acidiphilus]
METEHNAWWKEAVVYQIYPRSFMDGNGDGIGDLKGIIGKLDYLRWLGVDVIWLCPIYKSPNDDMGYDISDYRAIMDEFGTMDDFEQMLVGIHERGMKLVMDLVVNHTSDEHEWFVQSRASRDNPYRDYYIWRDRPNNWASFFGGSAWELDGRTGQYYLHLFSRKQPDLNWENPKVRSEIYDMMRWWLDKGVDGFRMDVINCISKVPGLPDAPGEGGLAWGGAFFLNGPRVHEYLKEMHTEVLSRYDVMTVGETLSVTPEQALEYVGFDRAELNMVFQFEMMDIDAGPGGKWDLKSWKLSEFKRIFSRWQTALAGSGWNSLYLNNHDQPRLVSRFGNDGRYRIESAKMLATLLHTLQGTPFVYQGEEIGMTNVHFDSIDQYRDIETINWYNEQVAKGERSVDEIVKSIHAKGRDNSRTPMQWSSAHNAGFSDGLPWLQVNENYREINVEQQLADPDSVLHYYRRLIQLRKRHPVMVYGNYDLLYPADEKIYAFVRELGNAALLTVLNFTDEQQVFLCPEHLCPKGFELVLSNYEVGDANLPTRLSLRPYEARVFIASPASGRVDV